MWSSGRCYRSSMLWMCGTGRWANRWSGESGGREQGVSCGVVAFLMPIGGLNSARIVNNEGGLGFISRHDDGWAFWEKNIELSMTSGRSRVGDSLDLLAKYKGPRGPHQNVHCLPVVNRVKSSSTTEFRASIWEFCLLWNNHLSNHSLCPRLEKRQVDNSGQHGCQSRRGAPEPQW